jgi:MFS family permease
MTAASVPAPDRPVRTPTWRPWVVWSAGVAAYVVAVLQRTSFGVAGIEAAHRFSAAASALSAFTVLQLLVYAVLQVPAGVLLDRFGTRRLVVVGAVVMAAGQLVLALSTALPLAVLGRVLVGAGDALTFISVLRLVTAWFPPQRTPVVTQLTGLVGQLGQVLSAVPLVAVLDRSGWTTAFASTAALGVLVALLVAVVVRDAPGVPVATGPPLSFRKAGDDLVRAWTHPGTRLGLWSHFATQFPGTVFVLMWGFPFLVSGEGVAQGTASALLTLYVVVGMAAGPTLGVLVARHPLRRSWLVLTIVGVNAAAWTAVLVWPSAAPLWLLALLVVALATGGPGSMVGFDYARTFNPADRQGTATGIVNVGGFVASLVVVLLVGLVLDATGGDYSLSDFRAAMSTQYALWLLGVAGVLVARRRVRRVMAAEGVVVPPVREVLARLRDERRRP